MWQPSRACGDGDGPSFFKIIRSQVLRRPLLGIPKKFISEHAKHLPDVVTLKVPSGVVWQVELRKIDGFVYFQNGIQEFLEHYSICVGHFLVFKFDRKSEFHVLIFDMSGNEVDYLGSANIVGQCKIAFVPRTEETEDDSHKERDSSSREILSKRIAMPRKTEKDRAMRAGNSFTSKYPFFRSVVAKCYLASRYMTMPISFYRRYFSEMECLLMQGSNRRKKWPVSCCTGTSHDKGTSHVRMTGISSFVSENKIKAGDICFFELVNRKKGLLKVHIVSHD